MSVQAESRSWPLCKGTLHAVFLTITEFFLFIGKLLSYFFLGTPRHPATTSQHGTTLVAGSSGSDPVLGRHKRGFTQKDFFSKYMGKTKRSELELEVAAKANAEKELARLSTALKAQQELLQSNFSQEQAAKVARLEASEERAKRQVLQLEISIRSLERAMSGSDTQLSPRLMARRPQSDADLKLPKTSIGRVQHGTDPNLCGDLPKSDIVLGAHEDSKSTCTSGNTSSSAHSPSSHPLAETSCDEDATDDEIDEHEDSDGFGKDDSDMEVGWDDYYAYAEDSTPVVPVTGAAVSLGSGVDSLTDEDRKVGMMLAWDRAQRDWRKRQLPRKQPRSRLENWRPE
eukprot:jgi/Botrbrau1/12352/Bobra.0239s0004.1